MVRANVGWYFCVIKWNVNRRKIRMKFWIYMFLGVFELVRNYLPPWQRQILSVRMFLFTQLLALFFKRTFSCILFLVSPLVIVFIRLALYHRRRAQSETSATSSVNGSIDVLGLEGCGWRIMRILSYEGHLPSYKTYMLVGLRPPQKDSLWSRHKGRGRQCSDTCPGGQAWGRRTSPCRRLQGGILEQNKMLL